MIASLVVPDGSDDVAVGTVIALIAEHGEAAPTPALAIADAAPAAAAKPVEALAPPPRPEPSPLPVPDRPVARNDGIAATPLAHRLATIEGLSLLGIKGSGARGRIVKADLGLPPRLAPVSAAPG